MTPEQVGSEASRVAAKMLEGIQECDSQIKLFKSNSLLLGFANEHPEIKAETLRLLEEERQAIMSLDPLNTSPEQIDEITQTYYARRESLVPNPSGYNEGDDSSGPQSTDS